MRKKVLKERKEALSLSLSSKKPTFTFNEFKAEYNRKKVDTLTLKHNLVSDYFKGRDAMFLKVLKEKVKSLTGIYGYLYKKVMQFTLKAQNVGIVDRFSVLHHLPFYNFEKSLYKKVNQTELPKDFEFLSEKFEEDIVIAEDNQEPIVGLILEKIKKKPAEKVNVNANVNEKLYNFLITLK